MTPKTLKISLAAIAMGLIASSPSFAADSPIYGSQLMSNQERIEHRNKMRSAKTAEEREQIRVQHHDQMQLRAKERGVNLPETPPPRGSGQGRGMGPGGGMGGMGPGGMNGSSGSR